MAVVLRSVQFRREREASWRELELLVDKAGKVGLRGLGAEELARLPHLYRATLSSLSVARAISLDKNLTDYLTSLAGRAYLVVYSTRQRLWRQLVEFFTVTFPVELRRAKWHVLIAALVTVAGAVAAFALVSDNPDRFYTFVGRAYAQGRDPAASTSELRATLYDDGGAGSALGTFAASLFTHNSRIGMLAFALGFAGLPALVLMFLNGLTLGAFAALFHSRGLSLDLWGWLLPHGVTELLACFICGGAGLILCQSLVFPGRHTRLENLALRGRKAALVVIGAVLMLLLAGLIEGVFRQLVTSVPVRYAVASLTLVAWTLYFGFAGRRGAS